MLAFGVMNGVTGKLNGGLLIRKQVDIWSIAADRCEAPRQEDGFFRRATFSIVIFDPSLLESLDTKRPDQGRSYETSHQAPH